MKNTGDRNDDDEDDPNDPHVLRRNARSRRDRQTRQFKKDESGKHRNNSDSNNKPSLARNNNNNKQSTYRRAKRQLKKQRAASAAFDLPEQPVVKTIGGGSNMIFAMAHRLFQRDGQRINDSDEEVHSSVSNNNNNGYTAPNNQNAGRYPRWRPTQNVGSISDFNPDFRTKAPEMNHQGYAATIWRNVRKRRKPSLWRYALRTYERMAVTNSAVSSEEAPAVERSNIHHQGALLAASKLGLWEKALEIYRQVEEQQETLLNENGGNKNNDSYRWKLPTHVTYDMVVSFVYACVRASRSMSSTSTSLEERRRPLDVACQVIQEANDRHGIPTQDTRLYNPLAAAYQRLRLRAEAEALLSQLSDRRIGPEPETGRQRLNIDDLTHTKDKGSYTLIVSGAVQEEDWEGAVDALRNMTDAGLYPKQRHLDGWAEISERKTKHRTTRSWKKKRDELWIERGLR